MKETFLTRNSFLKCSCCPSKQQRSCEQLRSLPLALSGMHSKCRAPKLSHCNSHPKPSPRPFLRFVLKITNKHLRRVTTKGNTAAKNSLRAPGSNIKKHQKYEVTKETEVEGAVCSPHSRVPHLHGSGDLPPLHCSSPTLKY